MAQLNKTLHIKKGGTEHTAKLYTTTAETGGTYGFLKVDGQQAYYALGTSSDGRATYGRVRKNNTEYAILNSGQIPYHKDNYTTPGTYTWSCPQGVTRVRVTLAGAGGGGAGTFKMTYNGGTGELITNTVAVTPGVAYPITVGGAGAFGFEEGTSGGTSTAFGLTARGGGAGSFKNKKDGVSYVGGGKGSVVTPSDGLAPNYTVPGNGWIYIEYGGGI